MLDELMGKDRDCGPDEKRPSVKWDTPDTCKHFLCGFCPAELFTNTRSDLGMCHLSHDERARDSYKESSRFMKMGYEEDFLLFLQNCFKDVTRRIERNHQRLLLSEQNQKAQQVDNTENEEKMKELSGRITKMLEDIEELGNQGEVDQAQDMMKVCDKLKEEREALVVKKTGMIIQDQFAVQEKQMEVCEVCGAFLIVGDAQSRVDDHLSGKQHVGYARIKSTIAEMKEKLRKNREKERSEIDARRNRRRSRDRSDRRSSPRRNEKSRDVRKRSRDRKADRGRSSRERRNSRERKSSKERRNSRERRSSKERSARKRSRSRDRSRRSRERRGERKRSRERRNSRSRRSRSRDKKRARRSRSRDKKSSRHESDRRKEDRKDERSKKDESERDRREKEEKKAEKIERSTSKEEGEITSPKESPAVAKITSEQCENTNGATKEENGTHQHPAAEEAETQVKLN